MAVLRDKAVVVEARYKLESVFGRVGDRPATHPLRATRGVARQTNGCGGQRKY